VQKQVQISDTAAGILKLSSPETTTFDLVGYFKHCGWLDNVVTVLAELAEKLDARKLVAVAEDVENKKPVRTPLLPSAKIKGAKTNSRWRVFINAEVEAEV
jgi:hypothetical protein